MTTTEFSQIPVGDPGVWDYSMRYNLWQISDDELGVLRMKYEILVKRSDGNDILFFQIQEILGKIYREIMRRKLTNKITEIENQELWKTKKEHSTAQR